jgi:Secretion system C-terminal sorting domain/Bacterial Ig-like domain (group 2)
LYAKRLLAIAKNDCTNLANIVLQCNKKEPLFIHSKNMKMKKIYLLLLLLCCLQLVATAQPTSPAANPRPRAAANVISIYNDAPYTTTITGTIFNPNWGQAGLALASEINVLGNNIRAYPGMNYQGVQFGTAINASSMDSVHFDIWSSNCTSIDIFLIAGAGGGEKSINRTLTLSAWNSIDIKLSDYSSQGLGLTNLIQFKFVAVTPATGANVYIDNMYFYTNAVLPTITNFMMPTNKKVGDAAFTITTPTSNSTGAFTYTSSNADVATISGNTITITGAGNATITATQAAAGSYSSGSATAVLSVDYNPPTVAATTPTTPAINVISLFSNAYTNRTVNTWNAGWGQANFLDTTIASNDTKRYSSLNYCGIEFTGANSINATAMNFFNVDIWTPNSSPIKVKLVDFGANNAYDGGGDDRSSIELVLSPAPTPGSWRRYSIPLSSFTGLDTRANLSQLLFVGSTTVIFVDNIFFSTGSTLAVSLTEFKGIKKGSTTELSWKTIAETNNKGFSIERSVNGTVWTEIGFVNGFGNSSTTKSYSFIDNNTVKGTNLYRLKQIDNDGKQTYSSNVAIKFAEVDEVAFSFFPNPVKHTLNVLINNIENTATLNLVGTDGRVVKSTQLNKQQSNTSFLIDVSKVTPGTYFLVLTNDKSVKSSKVVIQ